MDLRLRCHESHDSGGKFVHLLYSGGTNKKVQTAANTLLTVAGIGIVD